VISIVLPVFDEEDNIGEMYEALTQQLVRLEEPYEIVFVDDGSRDQSLERIRELCLRDVHVKGVSLSRNFGHQIAISAGLEYAFGDAVIVMDADLQHPPSLLPEMIARWRGGHDVVYTIREGRDHAGPLKRWSASVFYGLLNRMCDIEIPSNTPDFTLMDRRVVDALRRMPERARFLRGLVRWVGFKQTGIPFVAAPRTHGTTKYPLSKMLRFSLDGVTAFSTVPLRLASYVGLFAAISGIPYALWAVYTRMFTDRAVEGWASVIVALLFLGGVQLLSIGIMGEYLGRVYEEAKGRPLYLTQELIGEIGANVRPRARAWIERDAAAVPMAATRRSTSRMGDARP
jgi:glycosyltransferase involved in cell wall biosynthesis